MDRNLTLDSIGSVTISDGIRIFSKNRVLTIEMIGIIESSNVRIFHSLTFPLTRKKNCV